MREKCEELRVRLRSEKHGSPPLGPWEEEHRPVGRGSIVAGEGLAWGADVHL